MMIKKTYNYLKDKVIRFKKWLILIIFGATALAVGTQPITSEEIKWKKFTDNLVNIEYKHCGKDIKELKNIKGIWRPTEQEFEEIYQYTYGFDMVNWQLPDGTPMCGIGKEATNCVSHWKQEFENNKFKGNKQGNILSGLRNIRKNEVNADIYNNNYQPVSNKEKWNEKIVKFLQNLTQSVYAGVEFEDHFTVGAIISLEDHTPDTTGTGWSSSIEVGTCKLRINNASDLIRGADSRSSGGCYTSLEGQLCEADDTMSGADYEVSIYSNNGDTSDDTNQIACRIQDANNLYAVRFNESDADLYIRNGGTWSTIDTQAAGIADGSTLVLKCVGSTISVEDDGSEILSTSNATHSNAGKAGVGMGRIMEADDDMDFQQLDDFMVTVSGAPPAERRIINIH